MFKYVYILEPAQPLVSQMKWFTFLNLAFADNHLIFCFYFLACSKMHRNSNLSSPPPPKSPYKSHCIKMCARMEGPHIGLLFISLITSFVKLKLAVQT